MNHSTILRIYANRNSILTEPEYQRKGDIWTLEKRQLLIDSILNDFDIPKIYFHVLSKRNNLVNGKEYSHAIIDGRQRIETIWSFIEEGFPLSDDFKFFEDEKVKAGKLTYPDLSKEYPKLKIDFDSFTLPIVLVETDDIDLIEDMFSRLNEAVPLNAAEKRNAFGGSMAKMITETSNHIFFKEYVRFSNKRYQHKEVAAKLLYLEFLLIGKLDMTDIGKVYLDDFVKTFKSDRTLDAKPIGEKVRVLLDEMVEIFTKKDNLLFSQSSVPIYYLLYREAKEKNKIKNMFRPQLWNFKDDIAKNRVKAEEDIKEASYALLEYDRLSIQATNDWYSIQTRLEIIKKYLKI